MYFTTYCRISNQQITLAILLCLATTATSRADITGDDITGFVTKTNGGDEIIDETNFVALGPEFFNPGFQGLAYLVDVDSIPFNKVKISVCNPDPIAPQATVDTQWVIGDLDCPGPDGVPVPVNVTMLVPLAGNVLIVNESIPLGGDGFRIRTAPGQGLAPLESLCAEFAIVTENDVAGDVNGDGVVNLLDVGPFIVHVGTGAYSIGADVNRDGKVDLLDIAPFIGAFGG